MIKVLLNEKIAIKKLNLSESLELQRGRLVTLMINDTIRFLHNDEPVLIENESQLTAKDIIVNKNEIHLKEVIIPIEEEEVNEVPTTQVTILINNKAQIEVTIDVQQSLASLRSILISLITDSFVFQSLGCDIEPNDENEIKVMDMIEDYMINVRTDQEDDLLSMSNQDTSMTLNQDNTLQSIITPGQDDEQSSPSIQNSYQNDNEEPQTLEYEATHMLNDSQNQFDEVYEDYKHALTMPSCSEKCLKLLLFYTFYKKEDFDQIIIQDIDEQITKQLKKLKDRLILEEIFFAEIQAQIEHTGNYIKSQLWKKAIEFLKKMLLENDVLNIQALKILIGKVDEAARLIHDKDVVLFLGGTGAGKSTTIHYLAGSKMRQTEIGGLPHILAEESKNPMLKDVKTTPFLKSCTRYITAINVDLTSAEPQLNGDIVLVDSPGFEDTSGPEVDIANSVGIVKAIHGSKSVRPVILISYKSLGNKMTGVKDLAQILVNMIDGLNDRLGSFTYIFTKYPQEQVKYINAYFSTLIGELNDLEKNDINFLGLLQDMYDQTEEGRALAIDPLNEKPGKLLYKINKKQSIKNPSEVFKMFLSQKSQASLNSYVQKSQQVIKKAIKRGDYALLRYKLDDIKYLTEELQQQATIQAYLDCCQDLSFHLNSNYQESTKQLSKNLSSNNTLSDDDVKKYKDLIQQQMAANELICTHLKGKAPYGEAFISFLTDKINQMSIEINQMDISNPLVNQILDKIITIGNQFDQYKPIYQDIIKNLEDKQQAIIENFEKQFINNNFEEASEQFEALKLTSKLYNKYLDRQTQQDKLANAQLFLINQLQQLELSVQDIFIKDLITEQQIKQLDDVSQNFDKIINCFRNTDVNIQLQLTELNDGLVRKILQLFDNSLKNIKESTQKDNTNSTQNRQQYFNQMRSLHSLKVIEQITSEGYFSTIESFKGFINELKREIELLISQISQQYDHNNYVRLFKSLTALESVKWFENFESGTFNDAKEIIKQKLLFNLQIATEKVNSVKISLENSQSIQEVYKMIKELNGMLALKEYYPEIVEPITTITDYFKQTIKIILDVITSSYGQQEKNNNQSYEPLNAKKTTNFIQFLDQCQNIKFFNQNDFEAIRQVVIQSIEKQGKQAQDLQKITMIELQKFNGEESEKVSVAELSLQLHDIYKEASSLEMKYNDLYKIYVQEDILPQWKRDLTDLVEDLRGDMTLLEKSNALNALQVKLQVTKSLRIMDEFFSPQQQFLDLYKSFQDKFINNTYGQFKQVVTLINESNYAEISNIFQKLQQSKDSVSNQIIDRLKSHLQRTIQEIIDETTILVSGMRIRQNFNDEKMKVIIQKLKNLNEANKCLQEYLTPNNLISINLEKIQKTLSMCMLDYMKFIRGLIENDNFYEAKVEMTRIQVLCVIYGGFQLQESIDENTQLYKLIDVSLENVVKRFRDMEIEKYPLIQPKHIFEKLRQGNENEYNLPLNNIADHILSKLRNKLVEIQKICINTQRNLEIRKFETIIKTLPEQIKNIIEEDLFAVKSEIEINLENAQAEIDSYLQNENIEQIRKVYNAESIAGNKKVMDHIRQGVRKNVLEIKTFFDNNADNDFDTMVINLLIKLKDYKEFVSKYIPNENKQVFADVYFKIEKQLLTNLKILQKFFEYNHLKTNYENQIQTQLNRSFDTINDEESITDQIEKSKKALQWITQFSQFLTSNKRDFDDLFKQLEPKLVKELLKINNILMENYQKYKDSIMKDNIDILALKTVLKFMQKWDSVLVFLGQHVEQIVELNPQKLEIFSKTMTEQNSYLAIIEKVSHKLKSIKKEFFIGCDEITDEKTTQFQAEREKIYNQVNDQYQILSQAKLLNDYSMLDFNTQSVEQECIDKLTEKFNQIVQGADEILKAPYLNKTEMQQFNKHYNQINSFVKCIDLAGTNTNIQKNQITSQFEGKINEIYQKVDKEQDMTAISDQLTNIQEISENVQEFKQFCDDRIDQTIYNYKKRNGQAKLYKLGLVLDQGPMGKLIVQDNKYFEGFKTSLNNQKLQKLGIDYVMQNLDGTDLDKVKLRDRYDQYIKCYDLLIKTYLVPKMDLKTICSNLKAMVGKTSFKKDANGKLSCILNIIIYDNFPDILAHVCSLWTLLNAQFYFENDGVEDQQNYLFRPHSAQIISILRIFSCGGKTQKLSNNLVQIGTGEGKSITLAMTSILFALFGFDVNCACYSSYLSQRDYQSFKPLFDQLGVQSYIYYGTFGDVCETIINQNGDVREIIKNVLTGTQSNNLVNQKSLRPKILLVDEVDVFFSKDFYGKTYSPACCLKDPTISALIMLIWSVKDKNPIPKNIKTTNEYQQVLVKFGKWDQLIENAVENMIADVSSFKTPLYEVQNDKIGYKEQDEIAFNITYGYKTIFAYLFEHSNGKISKESLEDNLFIEINCGQFSFAEIPYQFEYIMGVTGTLKTLSLPELKVIQEEYKILKFTYSPSVYGPNNRTFLKLYDCKVETIDVYFMQIADEIKRKMRTNPEINRAVLVFFEDIESLMQFYNSPQYEHLLKDDKLQTMILTERANKKEKESIVRNATLSGKITLFTKCFGRGTDFIMRDDTVTNNGGLHVIQTFFSEEYSEEVQIMGRTARQGEHGSFSMVLLDKSLEKFLVTQNDITSNKGDIYDVIHNKRQAYFNDQYQNNKQFIDSAKREHLLTQQLYQNINDLEKVRIFLEDRNKGVKAVSISKTLVVMDGTGSMGGLISKAKNTVGLMFERAYQCLKTLQYAEGCFQLQFCIYRSYNSTIQNMLEASGWETMPAQLKKFIEQVSAKDGAGMEAVEIALQYANEQNKLSPLSQVILIGDAPPTPVGDVVGRRGALSKWTGTRFEVQTDYLQESQKLKDNKVQVHAFYVNNWAKPEFEKIAQITGGDCKFLDVNSEAGATMLTEQVTTTILRNVGKDAGKGEQLVQEYIKRYR